MLDTLKRTIIPVTALVLALLALALALALAQYNANWLWLLLIALPLVFLGIYDWQQTTWMKKANSMPNVCDNVVPCCLDVVAT